MRSPQPSPAKPISFPGPLPCRNSQILFLIEGDNNAQTAIPLLYILPDEIKHLNTALKRSPQRLCQKKMPHSRYQERGTELSFCWIQSFIIGLVIAIRQHHLFRYIRISNGVSCPRCSHSIRNRHPYIKVLDFLRSFVSDKAITPRHRIAVRKVISYCW